MEGPLKMITKMLVSAAIVLGSVWGAAPAGADPNVSDTQTNPFGSLTSSSQETTPADGQALSEELERGIWKGFSA
jgi:hypothetical protein